MKIKQFRIEGLKGIDSFKMNCSPHVNVIAGENGAGKSSILYALEIALSWLKARLRNRNASGLYPANSDIKKDKTFSSIFVAAYDGSQELDWEVVRYSNSARVKPRRSEFKIMTEYADRQIENYIKSSGKISLPMFVKYSVNRSLIDIPVKVRKKHKLDALSYYEMPIDAGVNLRAFYEWFREREDIENEIKIEKQNLNYEDRELKAVRMAISKVLPEYGELKSRRRKPAGFELIKDGKSFRMEQLSDGEKCYITLIADIARRLAIFNQEGDPLLGEGIILIDELELHLHPKWQTEAIDKLKDTFPNCQFFISSHSPHIIQNLDLNENQDILTLIDKGNSIEFSAENGEKIDKILMNIFGLESMRPLKAAKAEEKVWKFLRERNYEGLKEAEEELKRLIPSNDPVIARIELQKKINSHLA